MLNFLIKVADYWLHNGQIMFLVSKIEIKPCVQSICNLMLKELGYVLEIG